MPWGCHAARCVGSGRLQTVRLTRSPMLAVAQPGLTDSMLGTSLCEARRHKSFAERIQNMTTMKIGDYKPHTYTSKDVSGGPQAGAGHDPVYASYVNAKVAGPLRRKQSDAPEDYLNVDEASKWMEARNAAQVLGIKKADLPKLTKLILEDHFRKAYKERTDARQEEVMIATEVLLEYLDSSVHLKKSRAYYRKFLENVRVEVDLELTNARRRRTELLMWYFGFAITGACGIVLFVAYSRMYITRKDVQKIGAKTAEYFVMTFLQPKNTEPKPDYNTRYFSTPTAMEVDKKNGRYEARFLSAAEMRQAELCATYEAEEQAEILKLFNDERERSAQESRQNAARDSRVTVYRAEELEGVNEERAPRDQKRATTFENLSFAEFAGLLANSFGGGSHFQRLTEETSERTARLNAARERMTPEK